MRRKATLFLVCGKLSFLFEYKKKDHIINMYSIYQQEYDKTLFSKVCLFLCLKIKFLIPYPCSEHHIYGKKYLPQQRKHMKNKM